MGLVTHAPQPVARQNYQHAVHIAPPFSTHSPVFGDAVQAIKDTAGNAMNLMGTQAQQAAERAEQHRAE